MAACLHGDERCGEVAIERVLAEMDEETVLRPVAFVIANERAVEEGVRSIDADRNRSFPGDPESGIHEERLAHQLLAVLADTEAVLDLHATESDSPPFRSSTDRPGRRSTWLGRWAWTRQWTRAARAPRCSRRSRT